VGNHLHDLFEIVMMALALGMDAFSLSIGVGLAGIRRKEALQLCFWIGVFHVLLTLIGLVIGVWIEDRIGRFANGFGAVVLIGLGLHMLLVSWRSEPSSGNRTVRSTLAMLTFAAGVSVDAMSIGFTLGLRSAAYGVVSAVSFGLAGALLTGLGLIIGKRFTSVSGKVGEWIGAAILIALGLRFLFE